MTIGVGFAVATLTFCVVLMRQGDDPAVWYLGMLVSGVVLAVIGLSERSPNLAPFAGAAFLILAGVLGLWSVGFPALVGGWLVLGGAASRVSHQRLADDRLRMTAHRPA